MFGPSVLGFMVQTCIICLYICWYVAVCIFRRGGLKGDKLKVPFLLNTFEITKESEKT